MRKYYYDFHIHSCLSPCGDGDNTPNNLAGMAKLSGLDIVALTDHNTARNCPAFLKACEQYGILALAGMELTTSEDIHVVCLFERLDCALDFDRYVNENRFKIKNRPEIFGEQLILDEQDEVIGKEEYLLTSASNISVSDIADLIKRFGGVAFPAHIDREANGIVAVLGDLPKDEGFRFFELNDKEKAKEYSEKYGIPEKNILIGSDTHILTGMRDGENYFLLNGSPDDKEGLKKELFGILRGDGI